MLAFNASFLTALAHPCIGAFIGYLTNKIAIRMLFRPLHPWYVLGVRLPMTPGVIPSKRHLLAKSIGAMVGRHLLTSQDIGTAISKEPFQEHLQEVVERRIRGVMLRDLGTIGEEIPRQFRAYFKVGVKTIKYQLAANFSAYLAGAECEEQLRTAVDRYFDTLAGQEINILMNRENRQSLYLVIDGVVRDLLLSERTTLWLGDGLAAGLRKAAGEGQTLGDVLSAQGVDVLREMVRAHSSQILSGLGHMVADPVIRGQVITGVLAGVDHFLDALGPMGAMARGFLERDTLEQKISEYLTAKEADLEAWFVSPAIRSRLETVLVQGVDELTAKPLSELLAKLADGELEQICRNIAARMLSFVQDEKSFAGISVLIHLGMEDLLDGGHKSWGDVGHQCFGEDEGPHPREIVTSEILALVRSPGSERMVRSLLSTLMDSLLKQPVGKLYDLVPTGIRKAFTGTMVQTVNQMLLQEVPGVMESLNIERVISEKIDGLDLLQLEQLLLSIMEEQFKYINMFGAILGFLLGLMNLVVIEFL